MWLTLRIKSHREHFFVPLRRLPCIRAADAIQESMGRKGGINKFRTDQENDQWGKVFELRMHFHFSTLMVHL